ncbi:MAG TPA: DUF308 domain-containing protein [Candidatus Limnocylindria bacterium]|nr:DUF308 domain-containing protein [Candidatus Limnocylindria bacterium]
MTIVGGLGQRLIIGIARWWWTFILRGLAAIAFGLLAFLSPAWGIAILVALFAAWAIVDGAFELLAGIRTRGVDRSWWLAVLEGVVSIAAGVAALVLPPQIVTWALVIVIGAWSVLTGIIEIVLAIRLRRFIQGEVWMALAGVASILFGILIVLFPAAGALSLVWLIGAFAIVFGAFEIGLGWRLRRVNELAKRDEAHDYGPMVTR